MAETKRAYKLIMENGAEHLIVSEMSMFDIANDLRSKDKVSFAALSGEKLNLKSEEVRSIEHYRAAEQQPAEKG